MIAGVIPLNATWGKVKSVTAQTVTVTIDELDIENILLGFDKSGFIAYPKVGSDVLVSFFNNSKTLGCVICVKETDHSEIMGSEFGGIGLTEKIAERIKRNEDATKDLEARLNQHVTLFNVHTHSGVTAGAGSSGTPAPDTGVSNVNLTPRTNQDYISNDKIKHGKA